MSFVFLQQQIQEVFKNQQEQLSMQLLQQKNAGIVSQEVSFLVLSPAAWWVSDRFAARKKKSSGNYYYWLFTTLFFPPFFEPGPPFDRYLKKKFLYIKLNPILLNVESQKQRKE